MDSQLSKRDMGNTFTECIQPDALGEAVGAAAQAYERQLRTGKMDESDIFGVLSEQINRFASKKKMQTTEAPTPPRDYFNVSRLLRISIFTVSQTLEYRIR